MSDNTEVVTRPLTLGDAAEVFALTQAAERADTGASLVTLEDIRSDWARPSYRLGEQSQGWFESDRLVAYGEVHRQRLEGHVRPDARGRGLGTALFAWATKTARRLGYPRLGQTLPVQNSDGIALLRRHGATLLFTSWILKLPSGAEITAMPLLTGLRLGDFDDDRDAHAAYTTIEDAFNEWPDRQPSTFEDWRAHTIARSDFAPWQVVTAWRADSDGGESLVGVCIVSVTDGEGWVDQVAVRRDARGLGLGRALLVAGFGRARKHGARTSRLNTDSRTGALGLYEHVGMSVVETYENYAVELG